MADQHPMTPPTELLKQWEDAWFEEREHADVLLVNAYAAGAQAGADQELEACCEVIKNHKWFVDPSNRIAELRAARRPKPPSLKEQALALVEQHEDGWRPSPKDWDTIRRALEQLPDNE
jgi:hypothetical protein